MPIERLPRCALISVTDKDAWRVGRRNQVMIRRKSMATLTSEQACIRAVRLPNFGPRDPSSRDG